jgi:predicted signal transduction protein with EAL and GGDEF domain
VLIHLANLLLLGCYLVRDILLLRAAAVVASGCFIAYFLMLETPNLEAAAWNVVYVVVNAVQIALLVRERMRGPLTPAEAALRERIFPWMPAHKFATLVRMATPARIDPGDGALLERGHPVASLWLVEDGELEVVVDGRRVATCIPGDFIGEMAFIDHAAASATVRACTPSSMLAWDAERLRAMLGAEPEIQRGFHAALGTNMSQKLRRKAMQAVSGTV